MMKQTYFLVLALAASNCWLSAQKNSGYPSPEYSNEIYYFSKDSGQLMRLEKGFSKAESKTKMGGMGGGEHGYMLEGSRSPVRFETGKNFYFIISNGEEERQNPNDSDSLMQANGMDPGAMGDPMSMLNDPSRTTSLYKMNIEKDSRQITLQAYQGMKIMGKSKKESIKYTMSIKKIRNGYYELLVDKILPRGEYAFLVMDMGMGIDGNSKLFAFGVD
ncbi:MAG: hypothetical protein ACXWB9_05670 [Flavisolibacter sp.]